MKELDHDCLQTTMTQEVRLPSDGVDPSALSGPCRVYRLGQPMKLAQLEAMPADLQRRYLRRLRQHGGSEETVRRMLEAAPAPAARRLRGNGAQDVGGCAGADEKPPQSVPCGL